MNFENILKDLKTNLLAALGEGYDSFKGDAKKDIDAFLNESKQKLERWTTLLADKKINEEEFTWLVKSQKDLLILKALYKTGVSKIALGHLKNKIIKVIVSTIKGAVLA